MRKKVKYILFMVVIFTLILSIKSFARITTNDPTVNSGETVKITVSSQEGVASGAINVTSNGGLTFESVTGGTANGTRVAFAMSDNKTSGIAIYTFTAPNVTENKTYKIEFSSEDMADKDGNPINSSTAIATVTVKAKEQPQTPQTTTPTTPTTPQTPTTPTVTEPKFTDVNKIMYSTGDINLRASWSTSSAATKITKGTELKVTGTSTDKVNGYVWYRVSYNGATKYVASYLLTNTKPEEEKKSDNAYLKSLTIEGQELTPVFNKETTAYTLQLTDDITELNIKAETEDEKASVSIQGNKELKEGDNKVTVSVSAEDGTIKIYEITATKTEKTALGLKTLGIKDSDISSMFKTDTYEYEIYIKDVDKLEIEAIANDETATVEILGNEDLQEGENTITIIVSSQDGKENVTYQIKANKIIANANTIADTTKEINPKIYLYIGIGAVLLITLVIVIIYTIKHRNEDEFEYTDNFEGFPRELPERQEKYEENSIEENEQNVEQIQEENYNNEEIEEINIEEDRKSKIDYFLNAEDTEDNEKPKRRKGKHF